MNKSDLCAGTHGVETRDKKRYIVVLTEGCKTPFLLGEKSYTGLDGYRDDLRHWDHGTLDIVKVFTLTQSSMKYQRPDDHTVWEEDEEQACLSQIQAAEDRKARLEGSIEDIDESVVQLKKRLETIRGAEKETEEG